MKLELSNIFKRQPNMEQLTGAEATNAMQGFPVTANTAGLSVDETLVSVGEAGAVKVKIGGVVAQNASIVIACAVLTKSGKIEERGIFLSTLLRKIELSAEFKGMIGEDDTFEDKASFTNEDWVEAFKKAAPFKVTAMDEIQRDANMSDGTIRKIRVRELTFDRIDDAKEIKRLQKLVD